MSSTFTWKILHLERLVEQDSLIDVVATAYWVLEARSDDNGQFARHYGVQQLRTDNINPSTFTDYDSLTEAQVIAWVQASLNDESDFYKEDHATFVDYLKYLLEAKIIEEDQYRDTGTPW